MSTWMIVLLLGLLATVAGLGFGLFWREKQRDASKNAIFSSFESFEGVDGETTGIAGITLSCEHIKKYDNAKRSIFEKHAPEGARFDVGHVKKPREDTEQLDPDDSDSSDSEEWMETEVPWQRSLPADVKQMLRGMLIKRAISCIPIIGQLMGDLNAKYRFNQLQMLSPVHWQKVREKQQEVEQEIGFIRQEAELLVQGWGYSDQIFRDAQLFYSHNVKKANKLEEERRSEIAAKEELEKQKQFAERAIRGLLRQEESEKSRKPKGRAGQPTKRRNAAAATGDPKLNE